MAGVYHRYGVITVTNPDGTATSGKRFEVPRPYFQPKGITHREEAKGTPGVVTGGTFTVRGADGRDTTRVVAPKDARFIARGSLESVRATAGTPLPSPSKSSSIAARPHPRVRLRSVPELHNFEIGLDGFPSRSRRAVARKFMCLADTSGH